MSVGSEFGGEEEVIDLRGSGIVDGEDEDVDNEPEDVEDFDDEDEEDVLKDDEVDDEVPVEVSDVVDNGSDILRCWRCRSSAVGGKDIVVLGSIAEVTAVGG